MPEWNAKCKRQTETPILKNWRWWMWDSLHPSTHTESHNEFVVFEPSNGHMWDPSQNFSKTAIEWSRFMGVLGKHCGQRGRLRERMLCYSKVIIQHCLLHSLWPTLHFPLQLISKMLCHSEHLLNWGKGMLGLIWQKRLPMYTIYTHWNTHSYSTFLTQAWS